MISIEARELQAKVIQQLITLGWYPDHVRADVVSKDFDTAAGGRTAFLYCRASSEGTVVLSGDYRSEGNNVLSTLLVPLPLHIHDEAIGRLVETVQAEVIATVGSTYAMRLMAHRNDGDDSVVPRG